MNRRTEGSLWPWMAGAVLAHLAVSIAHGAAHNGAHIPMSAMANLFVFVVILAGPLVGLALSWRDEQIGSLIVALTMAGSLVFGFVNHFVAGSPDHISHVEAQWRTLFGMTAAMLTITEMVGLTIAVRFLRRRTLS